MKKIPALFLCLTILAQVMTHAQQRPAAEWKETPNELVVQAGKRNIFPTQYKVFYENKDALRTQLFELTTDYNKATTINLPTPDGDIMPFRIWQTPMMESELAAKYPDIKTFTAEAVNNHNITAKIDITPAGFHAMVFNGNNTYLMDPYSDVDNGYSLCYYKRDAVKMNQFTCATLPSNQDESLIDAPTGTSNKTFGRQRHTFRLALACTYEYAVAVGGPNPTKASVLAQMVLVMNRVNGIYERDLASTMVMVAKTDTLIYLTATDPYTNNNGATMLAQNQTTIDARIGTNNYDIGHVFSTGGGGIAYLGALCGSNKAEGVTGLSNPMGDAFAVDFVAHEIGHEFGADHTFNSNLGNCQGNYNAPTAFEPGSGSTIMAYAGICSTDDLQPHSDAYFHATSLDEIITHIAGTTCGVNTVTPNVPNTYPNFTRTYYIPNWTPFELTAPAVADATADTLLYCWEEWDLGGVGRSWNANNNRMPFFRSFTPTFSPTRVFPTINKVLAGISSYKGERLPYAARTLNFILTTRDIYQGYGAFNSSYDTDTITLITSAIAGATDTFKVTSQGTATTWAQGSTQTITWNVGTTTASPINASTVNIYLSTDSAQTFPYVLASNVPNNGSAAVTIPTGLTPNNKSYVKVKGYDNVFFQLNKANITITELPLAINLSSFNASNNGCGIDLHWTLANDPNTASIHVERSSDGKTFETIATLFTHENTKYTYRDELLKNGAYQYRIAILDKNGQTLLSNAFSVNLDCNQNNNVIIFPNPAKDVLNIQSTLNIHKISLYTATGQLIETRESLPSSNIPMDISTIANGVYLLQITTENGTQQNIKFIKAQ